MKLDNIRFIGRHIKKEGKEYFSYSGSGFEFAIIPQAPSCSITIVLTSKLNEHDDQYVGIYINNVFFSKERLIAGLNKIVIKLNDAQSQTVVRVIKLNEVYLSAIYLEDILLENAIIGELKPEKKELVGFFGDSITCGYGLSFYQGTGFKTEAEDFTKTYACLACLALNMNYTVVARSGISIGIKIWIDQLFNEIYDTVDMFNKCPTVQHLDYAVIYLGTNDQGGYYQNTEDKEEAMRQFHQEYHKLIDRIIKDNPGVKIVICYNMIELTDLIKDAIKEKKQYIESHYPNPCRLVEFKPDGNGADGHPYMTAHQEGAKVLVEAIKSFK